MKPANLFLTADGRVKILDFGLVRFPGAAAPRSQAETGTQTAPLTDPGTVFGTVGYMSPAELEDLSERRYVSSYHMAYVHTGLEDIARARDWLELACEERAGAVYGIKGSFLFASLKSHPRFAALLAKMNLA